MVGSRFEHGFEMGAVRQGDAGRLRQVDLVPARHGLVDPTSGFRAFSPRAIDTLTPIFPLKYLSDTVEVLYLAADNGLRVVTVPVKMSERAGGKPSAGLIQSVGYALRMMGIVASHTFAHRRRVGTDDRGAAAS